MARNFTSGQLVRIGMTFRNHSNALADPTTLILQVSAQDGTLTTYTYGTDAEFVKDSTGLYHLNFDTVGLDGLFNYLIQTTGTPATATRGSFYVEPSSITPSCAVDLRESVDGDVLPSLANTYDLGSAALPFADTHTNNVIVGNDILPLSASTSDIGTILLPFANVRSDVGRLGTLIITGTITSSLRPTSDNTYDIGTTTEYYATAYIRTLISNSTTDSTSVSTGTIRTAGGVGIAKALWVGGLANIAGAVTLQSTLQSTTYLSTSSVIYIGGTSATEVSLRRSGAALNVRLGDNSAEADLNCANIGITGNATASGSFLIGGATATDVLLSKSGAVLLVKKGDNSGYATVDALAYKVSNVAGVDASITSGDLVGKTITVSKGIITGYA